MEFLNAGVSACQSRVVLGRPAPKAGATPPAPGGACGSDRDQFAIVTAVASLYADELRPYCRILRKRLSERAASQGGPGLDMDGVRLRALCEDGCSGLIVVDLEDEAAGGDWSALLYGRAITFVDIYSPTDPYPEGLWEAAARCFASLEGEAAVLPGGRYACAQALRARDVECLQGLSLGQVCHFVQLAISQRKLLGYLNGAIVPYAWSQSMLKDHCAGQQRPCARLCRAPCSWPIATWDTARACLREMLASAGVPASGAEEKPAPESVPISNVKRLFRSRFHVELSETALGHSKLSELLRDPRLQDICTVCLRSQGYVVIPAAPSTAPASAAMVVDTTSAPCVFAARLSEEAPVEAGGPPAQAFCVGRPLDGFCAHAATSSPPVQAICIGRPLDSFCAPSDFFGIQVAPSCPQAQAFCVSRPFDSFSVAFQVAQSGPPAQAFCVGKPTDFDIEEPTKAEVSPTLPGTPTRSPSSTLAKDSPMGSVVRNTFIDVVASPPTPPLGSKLRRSNSLPRDLFSEKDVRDRSHALRFRPPPMARSRAEDSDSCRSSQAFCADEPLDFDVKEDGDQRCPFTPVRSPFCWPETPECNTLMHHSPDNPQVVRLSDFLA